MRSVEGIVVFAVVAMIFISIAALLNDDIKERKENDRRQQDLAEQKQQLAEEQRKTPYLMGYDACKSGVAMSKNPYNFLHNRDYAEWQRGWVQCKDDKKKEK